MPYLSDVELSQLARLEPTTEESMVEAPGPLPLLGGLGAAAVVGLVRSKFEDPNTGEWNIPGTKWDAEAVGFGALFAVAFGGQFIGLDRYRKIAALCAVGVGSHYVGELARRFGRTGEFSFHVGGNGPNWAGSSWEGTGAEPEPATREAA